MANIAKTDEIDVLDELAQLPTLAHPTVSPDGERVALYYDVTGRNELHVLDIETGELSQWSAGEVPRNARWFVEWDDDGSRVFFHVDEDGNEQNNIHVMHEDGTTNEVVSQPGQVVFSGNHEDWVLFASTRDGQMNLYRHDDDGEINKLTEYDRAVWGGRISPDGEQIAYATNETDDFDNKDVYVMGADGSNKRNLDIGDVGAEAMPVGWHPDGDRLLVSDNSADLGRAGVYELESGDIEWYGDGSYEESPAGFLDDGRVVVTRDRDAATVPVVYETPDDGRELDVPDGVVSFGLFAPEQLTDSDGRLVFTQTTPTRRPELVAYDLETDETEILIEAEYGPFSRTDFADAEYFTFTSDGIPETPQRAVVHDPYEELEIGALLYDSGERPSPLIVNPHGGPRARDTKRFNLYTQVLVSQGYSVLQVNYRGSTGRGREFVEQLIDDWGGAEQGDIAVGTEVALERYDWLDSEKVVVFGGSYGGYSAYWQLVQYPEAFDAGIAWIGLTDLEDQYENTMPHFRTELMEKYLGTPAENPELYRERSPVTHVENLDAPALLVHGVNDRRVPVSQARIFREALSEAGYEEGTDFEYQELGEEGHASTDQDQKLRMFELLADFLDRRA